MFRPFESEVVIARVKSSDEDGIRRAFALFADRQRQLTASLVTMDFFDDIYIPAIYLPQPSALYVFPSPSPLPFPPTPFSPSHPATPTNAPTSGSPPPP